MSKMYLALFKLNCMSSVADCYLWFAQTLKLIELAAKSHNTAGQAFANIFKRFYCNKAT